MDEAKIIAALTAHKREIEGLYARYSAIESLFTGVLLNLARRGIGLDVIKNAFEFAADTQIANADANPGATQTSETLKIIDELRDIVLPHNKPGSVTDR